MTGQPCYSGVPFFSLSFSSPVRSVVRRLLRKSPRFAGKSTLPLHNRLERKGSTTITFRFLLFRNHRWSQHNGGEFLFWASHAAEWWLSVVSLGKRSSWFAGKPAFFLTVSALLWDLPFFIRGKGSFHFGSAHPSSSFYSFILSIKKPLLFFSFVARLSSIVSLVPFLRLVGWEV